MISDYNQQFTVSAANLTRFASNVTGATFTLTATTTGDLLAHQVTVRNDSATDHSAKTLTLTGTDANGQAFTETMAAPGGSATVTSTKFFLTLSSVTVSATIGADTFDIGIAATARSPWASLDTAASHIFTAGVTLVSGAINYDILACLSTPPNGDSLVYNLTAAQTATSINNYSAAVHGVALDINTNTSAVVTFQVVQGPRK